VEDPLGATLVHGHGALYDPRRVAPETAFFDGRKCTRIYLCA